MLQSNYLKLLTNYGCSGTSRCLPNHLVNEQSLNTKRCKRRVDMNNIQRKRGFTIVELMIVIVVIAILAAITVVAYTGIQNRAHDTAVQNDLRQLGIKVQEWIIMDGEMPGVHDDGSSTWVGIERIPKWQEINLSHGSYSEGFVTENGPHNLLICRQRDGQRFAAAAWSQSGNGFVLQDGSVQSVDMEPGPLASTCDALGITSGSGPTGRSGSDWIYNLGEWRL